MHPDKGGDPEKVIITVKEIEFIKIFSLKN